jgi:DNA-binding PadR family transcriptional regulator
MLLTHMKTAREKPPETHLPLKPLVFQVLLALADGERHGWSLVRDVQQRGGFGRIMPGNFYRTLRTMLAEGLIEESPDRPKAADDDERRRYFRLTTRGGKVAAAEARRLEAAVLEARAKRLLTRKG